MWRWPAKLTLRGHLSGIPEVWLFLIHRAAVAPSIGKIPSSFAGSLQKSTPIHLKVATAQCTYVRVLQEIGMALQKESQFYLAHSIKYHVQNFEKIE